MSITRTLAAALAIAVLTAPTATAYDIHAPLARAAAKSQENEHLRSPDAKIGGAYTPGATPAVSYPRPYAPHQGPWSSLAGASPPAQELNPTPTKRLPGPPAAPPNSRPHTTPKATTDPGLPWTTIAIGVATGLLAIGAIASRTRRIGRARITA